ncbi:MAG: cupin, partial [Candidatus Cloacimonadota bacterium]
MEIKIEKLSDEQIEEKGIKSWPIWEKEVSRFDWHYDFTEECYILEG